MKLDPVDVEILRNKLTAIAEEMGITLQRTGRTLYVKETADFGTALANPAGKFFAFAACRAASSNISRVIHSGCMIIIVQSQALLSRLMVKVSMSSAHHRPSSGGTT